MSLISRTRTKCYRTGRLLGWVKIVEDILTGHPDRAAKKLLNKAIGRRLVSRAYLR